MDDVVRFSPSFHSSFYACCFSTQYGLRSLTVWLQLCNDKAAGSGPAPRYTVFPSLIFDVEKWRGTHTISFFYLNANAWKDAPLCVTCYFVLTIFLSHFCFLNLFSDSNCHLFTLDCLRMRWPPWLKSCIHPPTISLTQCLTTLFYTCYSNIPCHRCLEHPWDDWCCGQGQRVYSVTQLLLEKLDI